MKYLLEEYGGDHKIGLFAKGCMVFNPSFLERYEDNIKVPIIKGVDPMSFEPKIVAFCCNWCSYAAADLAGTSRMQYPHNIRIIRVMCSGMVHPEFVMDALSQGADGVMVLG